MPGVLLDEQQNVFGLDFCRVTSLNLKAEFSRAEGSLANVGTDFNHSQYREACITLLQATALHQLYTETACSTRRITDKGEFTRESWTDPPGR